MPGTRTLSWLWIQRRKPVLPCWVDSLLREKAGLGGREEGRAAGARRSRAGRVAVRAGGRAREMPRVFEAGKAHLL